VKENNLRKFKRVDLDPGPVKRNKIRKLIRRRKKKRRK